MDRCMPPLPALQCPAQILHCSTIESRLQMAALLVRQP